MAKSDKDHALQMLEMGKKDHHALSNMIDGSQFSEEVFGFHAQQAIEKALKAWVTAKGLIYPKSHDVSALIRILEKAGEDLKGFDNLEDYTIFAVQYRYEAYDESDEEIDRPKAVSVTGELLAHVRAIIDGMP